MGRRRTKLELDTTEQAELLRRLEMQPPPRIRERLKFVEHAASGRFTLEELAIKTGRSRSTIQNWQSRFIRGGLKMLLEREHSPGRGSQVGTAKIQSQLSAGLASGRLKTAAQISAWLETFHGLKLARKSVYYWLGKRRQSARLTNRRKQLQKPKRG